MSAVCVVLLASCGGGFNKIKTADQWVTYCDNESNIHRCLKTFDKIDFTTQCKIWDELTIMVANLRVDDVKGRIKGDAWGYLMIYSIDCKPYLNGTAFYEYIQSEKGKGRVAPRGRYIGFKSERDLAFIVVGSTRIDELLNKYQAE